MSDKYLGYTTISIVGGGTVDATLHEFNEPYCALTFHKMGSPIVWINMDMETAKSLRDELIKVISESLVGYTP